MPTMQHGLQHKLVRTTVEKGLAPREFKFVISSESVDRDKDIILLTSWKLDEYRKNPVVLASHAHDKLPVGKTTDIGVRGKSLKATVEFPPQGVYAYADQVHDLVDLGFLKAASVGFRADESEPNGLGGMTIKKATLLEWSICSIGSNPDALVQRAAPVQMQKWLKSQAHDKEDTMYVDIIDDDEPYFELVETKDRSPFEIMCDAMLANYAEMDSAKFRELMARQLALLGPGASIVDLVHALAQQGVAQPRSAPGFHHLSTLEQINYKNACDQRAGYYPYR